MAAWTTDEIDCGQHRHLGTEEALVLVQLPGREGHDRLVGDLVELPQAEEVVEHLGLDDLGRLRHPDPLGEPGELDRGRHRDEVAIAFGKAAVDGDQAVFGVVRVACDLGGRSVGQLLGRADQDGPCLELEEAAALDLRRRGGGRSGYRATTAGARRSSTRGLEESHPAIMRRSSAIGRSIERPGRRGTHSYGSGRWRSARRSPARTAMSSRFSGGASGHAQRGSNAHDGWNGEIEVDDERAGRRVATQVRALGGIDEVPARGVRLVAVRRVAERDEQPARVTGHPEDRERAGALQRRGSRPARRGRMRGSRLFEARRARPRALFGSSRANAPGAGGGAGSMTTSKRRFGSWSKCAASNVALAAGGTGDCGCSL